MIDTQPFVSFQVIMRRNAATLLKYFLVACVFMMIGPLLLRFMHVNSPNDFQDRAEGHQHLGESNNDAVHKASEDDPKGIGEPLNVHPNEFVDWHDYKAIAAEKSRKGPGEQGAGVRLGADEEKEKGALYRTNGFNALVSDKISLYRALRDIRHPDCQQQKYRSKLLTASIIIPFHEEHWSTLLRTFVSCMHRAPAHLIKEVILVDDFSTKPFLKQKLDDYVKENYKGKVRVLRAAKREGLIRTRLLGAHNATGDVMIFLDSHCECNINWLPPLLDPIAKDYRTVVCPFIDVLDYETFEYRAQDEGARGAFDWELYYKRLPLLPEDLKHPARPFRSPVMAGGLFAISRQWFWTLGGYDPGLDIWGGEQYELSFKIWQCGGSMVDAPCSRIGHVYRKFAPFSNPGVGDFVGRNYRRVAEVWMDEYKEYIYNRRPHYRKIDPGDLTSQLDIRKQLKCKSFRWFMTKIAFDLVKHYPPVEPPTGAKGEIRSVGSPGLCIDTQFKRSQESFGLQPCLSDNPGASGEQQFEFTWHKDVRPVKRSVCFDVPQNMEKAPVILYQCHNMKGNQHWKVNPYTDQLFHVITGKCLDSDKDRHDIFMRTCDSASASQKWRWTKVKKNVISRDW